MKQPICNLNPPRLITFALTFATAVALGQMPVRAADELSAADKSFFKKAAEGGMAEVELGKLAEKKGMSNDTKEMGKRMVTDHSKANEELEKLASSKGVTLPKGLSAAHKSTMNSMEKMEGDKFDHQYHADMIRDHKEDIALFEKAAGSKDGDIKAFAEKTLPTLKEHLAMFEKSGGMTEKNGDKKMHDKAPMNKKVEKTPSES